MGTESIGVSTRRAADRPFHRFLESPLNLLLQGSCEIRAKSLLLSVLSKVLPNSPSSSLSRTIWHPIATTKELTSTPSHVEVPPPNLLCPFRHLPFVFIAPTSLSLLSLQSSANPSLKATPSQRPPGNERCKFLLFLP